MSNIQVSLNKIKKEIESVGITDNIALSEDENSVVIIDQVKIPNTLEYKTIDDLESAYQAIKKLEVRGAPAIGIFAGYTMYILSKKDEGKQGISQFFPSDGRQSFLGTEPHGKCRHGE